MRVPGGNTGKGRVYREGRGREGKMAWRAAIVGKIEYER